MFHNKNNSSYGNHVLEFSSVQRKVRESPLTNSNQNGVKAFDLAVTAAVTNLPGGGSNLIAEDASLSPAETKHAEKVLTWSWFFGQLLSYRLFPAFCSIVAMFMIVRYLKTVRGMMIKTHFQIYCLILSVSDFCISISGFMTSLGIIKFIQSPWLSTLWVPNYNFFKKVDFLCRRKNG